MRIPLRIPQIAIGPQIGAMARHFPIFTYRRANDIPTWRGTLQPTRTSPVYVVEIRYRQPKPPEVHVLSPSLKDDAPHRYSDGSLCLYYPRDRSWTSNMLIAQTIVPWTAIWLAFYELWLRTGEWHGEEAPHHRPKHR
jgi:hypothetical protein